MVQYTPGGGGPSCIAAYAVMGIASTITFVLRVYVRVSMVKRSWEDWAAGVGWLFFMSFTCLAIAGAFYGFGQHHDLIPPAYLPIALRMWWFNEILYAISNMAVKLSIALMLLRVVVEDYHKKTIYVVTGLVEVYSVLYFIGFLVQCVPASLFWTRVQGDTNGHCVNQRIIVIATYVYSFITVMFDWTMALLPWFVVRKSQLDLRTRLMVTVVLSLASIASVATIVRIPFIAGLIHTDDFLYSTIGLGIWSGVETGLSIIASNAATLRPLFRKPSDSSAVRTVTPTLPSISTVSENSSTAPKGQQSNMKISEQDMELGSSSGRWRRD